MIDLALVFELLRPGAVYRLNSSVPPHFVIEWRGPGTCPDEQEIVSCWETIKQRPAVLTLDDRLKVVERALKEGLKI